MRLPALQNLLLSTVLTGIVLVVPAHRAGAETASPEIVECTPACGGLECGDDGCGGSCGSCSAYEVCQDGSCFHAAGCTPLTVPGCGGCTCEACACALDPYCCTGAWDPLCVTRCNDQCGGCGTLLVCGDGTCAGAETCATCPADCGQCPPACGPISSVGCCAESTLLKCQAGSLKIANCAAQELACGWDDEAGNYACGGSGADPSGTHPVTCPKPADVDVVEEIATPAECAGLGFAGCCAGQELFWCDGGGLHQLDCALNPAPFDVCGWNVDKSYYDCGGEGTDPSGEADKVCPQFQVDVGGTDTVTPVCKVGTYLATGCGDVPWEGCCDQNGALLFCEAGQLLCRLDCSGLVYPSNTCGWHSGQSSYYDCGGEGSDPSGEFPLQCSVSQVEPDIKAPDVVAKTCDELPETGCCDGSWLHWCENGIERLFNCQDLAADPVFSLYIYCGSNPVTGQADCLKKPDPSPPECQVGVPEPAPEPQPEAVADTVEPAPEITTVGDLKLPETFVESGPEAVSKDGSGIVIPVDNVIEPEEKPGKDGCNIGAAPGRLAPWLVLALLLILVGLRRCPPTEKV